jgi:hypothetical protein
MAKLRYLLIAACLLSGWLAAGAVGAADDATAGQLIGLCCRDGSKDVVLEEMLRTEGVPYVRLNDLGRLADSRLKGLVLGEGYEGSAAEIGPFVERGGVLLCLKPAGQLAEMLNLEQVGVQKNGCLTVGGQEAKRTSYEGRLQLFGESILYRGGESVVRFGPQENSAGVIRAKHGKGTTLAVAFDLPTTFLTILQPDSDCGKCLDTSNIEYDLGDAPQVDVMRRLLVGLFLDSLDVPLMRKWYFPSLRKAMLVPTGDQDGIGFEQMKVVLGLMKELGTPYTLYVTPTMQSMTRQQFQVLADGGMEFALHPDLAHGNHQFTQAELESQLKQAVADVGAPMIGVRTHSGRWATVHEVPVWAGAAQLQYNSDLGCKWWESKPGKDGYWLGTGLPYRFIDTQDQNRRLDCLEIPVHMSDCFYFWKPHQYPVRYQPGVINWGKPGHEKTFLAGLGLTEDEAFELFKRFFDREIEQYHGAYCYDWHPHYLAAKKLNMKDPPYYRTDAHFRKCINYAKSRGAGLIGANGLNDFWRAREKVVMKDIVWAPESATMRCTISGQVAVRSLTLMGPLRFHGKKAAICVDGQPTDCVEANVLGGAYAMFAVDIGPKERLVAVRYD